MAVIEGYTGIPDTLPEAQAMIVRLLKQLRRDVDEMAADQNMIHEEAQAIKELRNK